MVQSNAQLFNEMKINIHYCVQQEEKLQKLRNTVSLFTHYFVLMRFLQLPGHVTYSTTKVYSRVGRQNNNDIHCDSHVINIRKKITPDEFFL